ncbi:MAG: DNA-3-methyladenine glycosylase 2 family protein [Acidobacteria bacterium]|nr:DNA-3-methyladenine glycosylase 2 family protein [Acidobacteriota bacterium]
MRPVAPPGLTATTFHAALRELADRDADLARVVETLGPPPFWNRPPGFPTLVHLILEQQVSLASARAVFDRLRATLGTLTAPSFLTLDDDALRALGFSRQKTRYCRLLAAAVAGGELDLDGLDELDDDRVHEVLVQLPGIGRWTTSVYLLMALRRPDAWPVGDLALQVAAQKVKGLGARPSAAELETLGEPWRPWRAVAARVLWHHYLTPQS